MPRGPAKNEPQNTKAPKWLIDYFRSSLDAHKALLQIVRLSQSGISTIRAVPKAVEALALIDGTKENPDTRAELENAESQAKLAQTEIETDFPVLHRLAVVALWSWLEDFVKGLAALWLRHKKDARSVAAVQKLRIRFGDYIQLSKTEQAAYLVELLEQDIASQLKRGVNRFESILDPFHLSGAVPEDCARTLFELQQIRNAIAHRNGNADRRLKQECPWLKVRNNQPVMVSNKMFKQYSDASAQYLLTVLYRVGDLYGKDLRTTKSESEISPHEPPHTDKALPNTKTP